MKSWLVTGGEGFIGGTIVRRTGAASFDIKSGKDILNTAALASTCEGVNGIFHCAAKISVPESIQNPEEYYLHNVTGTTSVIEAAKKNAAKIVFSSSAAVYGELNRPAIESDPFDPVSPYAENKRDGEELIRTSGMSAVLLRYFNVYGPGQSAAYAGVITAFIQEALNGEDLVIHGDGEQVRDFVFVDDVARANIAAMESESRSAEVFNIGSGTQVSINQLAEEILRLTNSASNVRHEESRAGDIRYSQANIEKAASELGWKPEVSLQDGLKRTIESYVRP